MLIIYMITSSLLIAYVTPQRRLYLESISWYYHDSRQQVYGSVSITWLIRRISRLRLVEFSMNVLNTHIYGICNDALNWIQSYLSNRTECMAVGSCTSTDKHLNFGVPQGSVLGPRKYCLYSKPIGEICRRHNLLYHCYADDTQVYMVIRPSDSCW